MTDKVKTVHLHYYAVLREESGISDESVQTLARTPADLYTELADRHGFSLEAEYVKVVVNAEIREWGCAIRDGDTVIFLPPVSGG